MTQGSFADFMSCLEALHGLVGERLASQLEVTVYRWRPTLAPKLPAIYPWVADSPYVVQATGGLVQDTVNVSCRVAGRPAGGDGTVDGQLLELLIDAYRDVIDTALYDPQRSPFAGVAKVVDRQSMRNVIDRFGDVNVLCMEFPLQAQLSRILRP